TTNTDTLLYSGSLEKGCPVMQAHLMGLNFDLTYYLGRKEYILYTHALKDGKSLEVPVWDFTINIDSSWENTMVLVHVDSAENVKIEAFKMEGEYNGKYTIDEGSKTSATVSYTYAENARKAGPNAKAG